MRRSKTGVKAAATASDSGSAADAAQVVAAFVGSEAEWRLRGRGRRRLAATGVEETGRRAVGSGVAGFAIRMFGRCGWLVKHMAPALSTKEA